MPIDRNLPSGINVADHITARHAATRVNVPCNSPASNITASVDVPGNVTARNVASRLNVTANDAAVDVATYLQLFDEALDDVDLDPTVQCVLLHSAINQNVPAIGNLDAAACRWVHESAVKSGVGVCGTCQLLARASAGRIPVQNLGV